MGAILSTMRTEYKTMMLEDASEKNEYINRVTVKQFVRPIVIAIVSSFVWTEIGKIIAYRISHHFKEQPPDRIRCYVLATIHSLYLSCYGLKYLIKAYNKGDLVSTGHLPYVAISLGYFISDTLNILKGYPLTLFHHFMGIICELSVIIVPSIRKIFPCAAIIEFTTFMLCLSWFSKELLSENHNFTRFLSRMFAMTYLVVRCIYFPSFIYYANYSEKTKLAYEKLGTMVHYAIIFLVGLQFYWGIGIVKLLYKNTMPVKTKKLLKR